VLYDLTDWLIGPLKELLQTAVNALSGAQLVAARGINPSYYLGGYAWAGPAWLGVIKTVVACAALYALVFIAKALYQLYLDIKAGVKWW
jgi:hypothetical protein